MQCESAISVYIPPSWVSLLPRPLPNPLGCPRAPGWAPCIIPQIPTSYLFCICYHICFSAILSICPHPPFFRKSVLFVCVSTVVQSPNRVWLFVTPWRTSRQASPSRFSPVVSELSALTRPSRWPCTVRLIASVRYTRHWPLKGCLHCCPANRCISNFFLDFVYMC